MEQVIPGLHASPPLDLGFARLQARTYLLERGEGNVLIYGGHALDSDDARRELDALGGVDRHYLNHSHEASSADDRLGAPLLVHEGDAPEVAKVASVADTFSRRHRLGDDLEVVPVPGHTPGATAFLWETDDHRVLFTGDTLFVRDGRWIAAVLDGISDREAYLRSLAELRDLAFDLLVPGVHPIGQRPWVHVEPGEGAQRIEAIRERLARGEDN